MNNKALNELLKKGDERSFTLIFEALYQPLVAYLMQYVDKAADAEDIAQSTFIKLWEKKDTLNLNTSIKSYTYSTAYNLFIDNYRKKKKQQTYLDQLKNETITNLLEEPDDLLEHKLTLVAKAVEALPERCRLIFTMHKKQGYSHKEIAKKLQISTKTVEAQLRIAYSRLREELKNRPDLYLMLVTTNSSFLENTYF
ncbi:RNA polymerase sigma factor [Zunongwangia pacifica]|uniref:RNA polymerase sigma-70 factor n=1 Tax=Zunongwangia pacifica TaxID=2911062 RepID=A0A9X2A0P8_9FLAO|nr:RNA polymerase sigma-70 factor [Zunongwangia pacifica]MCL6218029.1 RNA polymerase sigma-70 factor [Zunongwangia pacifica]